MAVNFSFAAYDVGFEGVKVEAFRSDEVRRWVNLVSGGHDVEAGDSERWGESENPFNPS